MLWFLFGLFALRVVGQVLVAFFEVGFLPPMQAWYSGLMPYRYLLPSQILLMALMAKICVDFTRRRGFLRAEARSRDAGPRVRLPLPRGDDCPRSAPLGPADSDRLPLGARDVRAHRRAFARRRLNDDFGADDASHRLPARRGERVARVAAAWPPTTGAPLVVDRVRLACPRRARRDLACCTAPSFGRRRSSALAWRASPWSPARLATFSGRARDAVLWIAGAKLVFYWWWMLGHDEFIYVVLDTGIGFAAVAAMHLWRWNGWIVAGVVVSVGAALVQASGVRLHAHFNQ